jgi:hypothetical protein
VRPSAGAATRAEVLHEWHKSLLHKSVPPLIRKWEQKLGVKVIGYFLQRMKTKWGSCNHRAGHIRLNTELVKKPKDLLEYVIVHEMAHLREPTHSERFVSILDQNYPGWREARAELNELPLGAEKWASEICGLARLELIDLVRPPLHHPNPLLPILRPRIGAPNRVPSTCASCASIASAFQSPLSFRIDEAAARKQWAVISSFV